MLLMYNNWDWAQFAKSMFKIIHLDGFVLRIDLKKKILNNDDKNVSKKPIRSLETGWENRNFTIIIENK